MKAVRKVDNVGKLFLSTCNPRVTNVFRLSCELNDPVDADCLTEALRETIKCFPFFQVVIKKTLLWYYFEESEIEPSVVRGAISPCVPIYQKGQKTLLYRVSCHNNYIHLDIFHALTDGAGAAYFLRMLVGAYVIQTHGESFGQLGLSDFFDVRKKSHELDGFETHYDKPAARKKRQTSRSYQIRGDSLPDGQIHVFRAFLPTHAVLHECRQRGVSLTELLTAVYIDAIHKTMSDEDRRKPVAISIPVNLRKYFPSETVGNFFALIDAKYDFSQNPDDLSEIMKNLHYDLGEQLQPDRLKDNFSHYVSYEHNFAIKVAPLAFKTSAIRLIGWYSKHYLTSTFSNVGKVEMPPAFAPYIRRFSGFYHTNSIRMCAITYEDELCILVISALKDESIPKEFFNTLSAMGLSADVTLERLGLQEEGSPDFYEILFSLGKNKPPVKFDMS